MLHATTVAESLEVAGFNLGSQIIWAKDRLVLSRGDYHWLYEPFMGSGTTLIVAESTGRVCFGIELSPAYVDVAVQRWQQFTGQKTTLDGIYQTFADLAHKPR